MVEGNGGVEDVSCCGLLVVGGRAVSSPSVFGRGGLGVGKGGQEKVTI